MWSSSRDGWLKYDCATLRGDSGAAQFNKWVTPKRSPADVCFMTCELWFLCRCSRGHKQTVADARGQVPPSMELAGLHSICIILNKWYTQTSEQTQTHWRVHTNTPHPHTHTQKVHSIVLLVLIMLERCSDQALSYKLTASCGWAPVAAYYCYSATVHSAKGDC